MASLSKQNIKERILQSLEKDTVRDRLIVEELEQSFLDYSMSVITSRALPNIKDGLKPVHRRILYSAYEGNFLFNEKYKKSAALVGSVMGSYHPHGDASIYDALVRMAQDFSLRYPLIDGQGNFGSIDGDAPAAMRYTEARLSKLGERFLDGIKEECVEFTDNYDQSRKEPTILPTLIPNILINGSEGIAVGIATKLPPHNLSEIVDAAVAFINNPEISDSELRAYIKGPDFPTGGEVLKSSKKSSSVNDYFEQGKGSFIIRSKIETEELPNKRNLIIIKEIPYGVKKSKIIESIVELIKKEKSEESKTSVLADNILDIRDESSLKEGIRIVIECRAGIPTQVIINNLYKHTRAQVYYAPNLVILTGKEPKRLGMFEILKQYVHHQFDILVKRTQYQKSVLERRIHILEGRIKIIDDIENVIEIIRTYDNPESELQTRYGLTEEQLKDIMDLKIRSLKKLSVTELKQEFDDKNKDLLEKERILGSEEVRKSVLSDALLKVKEEFGDERRTKINDDSVGKIEFLELFHFERMLLSLTKNGYVNKKSLNQFKQNKRRGGAGTQGSFLHKGDVTKLAVTCDGKDDLLFFTNKGKVYKKKAYELNLPERGKHLKNILDLETGESVLTMISLSESGYKSENFLFFATKQGIAKKTLIEEFKSIRSNGKIAIKLKEGDELRFVIRTQDNEDVIVASSNGHVVRTKVSGFRALSRPSRGSYVMKVDQGEEIVSLSSSLEGDYVLSIGENGLGKITSLEEFRLVEKGKKRGVKVYKTTEKTGKFLSCAAVNKDDVILLMTKLNKVNKFTVENIRETGRYAQGVILMKLDDKDKIVYYSKTTKEDDSDGAEEINDIQEGVVIPSDSE